MFSASIIIDCFPIPVAASFNAIIQVSIKDTGLLVGRSTVLVDIRTRKLFYCS